MKKEKIHIIPPSRIGDSILSLPAIICLEQLNKKYNKGLDIKVLTIPLVAEIFSGLGFFNCTAMSKVAKLKSFFDTPDRAFFVETTNKNFGYHSKKSYGTFNEFKKFLKFDEQVLYLKFSFNPFFSTWEEIKASFPEELVTFLSEKYGLSIYSMCLFGICLELGFTAEQIIETFDFNPDIINLDKFSEKVLDTDDKYYVFCMEAGYGRKLLEERCWDKEAYFEIAKRCYEDSGIKAVFVGMDNSPIPEAEYITDLRAKISLRQLACLYTRAEGYIGNDTGPMHLANLMKLKSTAMYFKQEHKEGFGPIFPQLNTQIFMPDSVDEVYARLF